MNKYLVHFRDFISGDNIERVIYKSEISDYLNKSSPHKITDPSGKKQMIVKPGGPDFYSLEKVSEKELENLINNINRQKELEEKEYRRQSYEELRKEFE